MPSEVPCSLVLTETQEIDEGGNDDHAAAQADQSAEHAGGQADDEQ